jgi:DNA/RNA endonuclease G (NUC1)
MSSRVLIGLVAGVAAIASTNGHAEDKITAGEDCAHIFVETGIPEMEGDTAQTEQGHVFICRDGYAVYLNTDTRNPDWVAEDVTADEIKGKAKRKDNFAEDQDDNVAVPSSFYKIVYHPATKRAMAFLLPNKKLCKRDPKKFLTTISHVEELTGVVFFPALSRRDRTILEKNVGNLWGW